ncbi:MAG TPA: DASS family sodium-coupled anion symporter [Anaerolineae bacterium]|jgi:sodium-dependent dicarboxylate transporter 2/3/5|nr:DASS family sodium-coupled anion symporter [Anaerolineae bacterium]
MSAGGENQDQHISAAVYVTGRLSSSESQVMEAHLAGCARCRAAVDAVQRLKADHSDQNTRVLVNYVADLLVSTVVLVAPIANQLAQPAAPPEPQEVAAEQPAFEPLRVLQPRIAAGANKMWRFVGRFGLVLFLTIIVLLIPRPDGLTEAGQHALAAFVFTGSILALEPVSLPIAALMVPLALVALSVANTTEAFEPFSRPVVFLILASLFIAEGLRKHGLTRRLALQTLVAAGGKVSLILLGIMLIAGLFSMWVENTATAAVLIPVALTVASQVPDPNKAKGLLILLVMGIAYSASLGGMATVMGAGSNAVAAGFLTEIMPFSFVDWMVYGMPAFILLFPVTWFLLLRLIRVEVDHIDVQAVRRQLQQMGPLSSAERELSVVMAVTIILWVGGSFLEPALQLPSTLLAPAMVAIMAVSYLAIRGIINWEDVKGVSWGIFFMIGAGLALGAALTRTGATDWVAELISPIVSGPPLIISILLLVFLSALLTNVMNNTTIAAVFVPILISLARTDTTLNPVLLVLAVTLATTFGYSLPSASGRMALVSASGIIEPRDMIRYGLVATTISALILGLFFYITSALNLI